MFDLDKWQEILATMRSNKLRTLLTGFSVAWGILMLVVLLGSGTGLANGIEYQFRDDATNSIWVRSGQTSIPFRGLQPGRDIQFTNEDHAETKTLDGVENVTSRFYIDGETTVSRGSEYGNFGIRAVHPEHRLLEKTIVTQGRFINDLDVRGYRKVAAIGEPVGKALFAGESALGEYININGIPFKVVGLFRDEGGAGEEERIYLPISTAQRNFNGGNNVAMFMFTTGDADLEESGALAATVRRQLAQRHHFAEEDERAVSVNDNNEQFQRFVELMLGIRVFIWIVGVGTILAGLVGVSTIMMIAVKERTKEIGIKRAIGASPLHITSQIVLEAVVLTAAAGYVGLLVGIGVVEGSRIALEQAGGGSGMFQNPGVGLSDAFQALLILIVSGVLAGLIPAQRAISVSPVAALHSE